MFEPKTIDVTVGTDEVVVTVITGNKANPRERVRKVFPRGAYSAKSLAGWLAEVLGEQVTASKSDLLGRG